MCFFIFYIWLDKKGEKEDKRRKKESRHLSRNYQFLRGYSILELIFLARTGDSRYRSREIIAHELGAQGEGERMGLVTGELFRFDLVFVY